MVSWYHVNGDGAPRAGTTTAGDDPDFTWEQILEKSGNEHVKSISIVAGCALGDGGETLVNDLTVNDRCIDFE